MSYKNRTPYFGIPFPSSGQGIYESEERRKYTIIENMLIAGVQGLSDVVYDDGQYSLGIDADVATVSLQASFSYPSAEGLAGKAYFKARKEIKWEGMKRGGCYFLYIRPTTKTFEDPSDIRLVVSNRVLPPGAVLMATLDWTGESPILNSEPDGKVYSGDIAKHASDSVNPHGQNLEQDNLIVNEKLIVRGDLILQSSIIGKKLVYMDIKSGGPKGVIVTTPDVVWHVVAQRLVSDSFDGEVGDIGIGYFGSNSAVDKPEEFILYNSRDIGIPLRCLVIYGEKD